MISEEFEGCCHVTTINKDNRINASLKHFPYSNTNIKDLSYGSLLLIIVQE